jgi:hypothetical protein
VRYRPAAFYVSGMHPYCPAVPWMPGIADFTEIPTMGVVLLSCITRTAFTIPWKRTRRIDGPSSGSRHGAPVWIQCRGWAAFTTVTPGARRRSPSANRLRAAQPLWGRRRSAPHSHHRTRAGVPTVVVTCTSPNPIPWVFGRISFLSCARAFPSELHPCASHGYITSIRWLIEFWPRTTAT